MCDDLCGVARSYPPRHGARRRRRWRRARGRRETLQLLQLARSIYVSNHSAATGDVTPELLVWHSQAFARAYEQMHDDPMVKALQRDVKRYHADLTELRIADDQIARHGAGRGSTLQTLLHLVRAVLELLQALPLLVPGIVLHGPIMFAARVAVRRADHQVRRVSAAQTTRPDATGRGALSGRLPPTPHPTPP